MRFIDADRARFGIDQRLEMVNADELRRGELLSRTAAAHSVVARVRAGVKELEGLPSVRLAVKKVFDEAAGLRSAHRSVVDLDLANAGHVAEGKDGAKDVHGSFLGDCCILDDSASSGIPRRG